jgi:hypothetical protein
MTIVNANAQAPAAGDLAGSTMLAVYTALVAGVTLAPVYTVPPIGAQPPVLPPVVIIAEIQIENVGSKDVDIEKHIVRVVTEISGGSRAALFALMAQVKAALVRVQLVSPGVQLSPPMIEMVDETLAPDGVTMIGQQHFLIFAQSLT